MSGWIGVDFDGTLSVYTGGLELGPPVPLMVERVKAWLKEGREVRIMTARVGACHLIGPTGLKDDHFFAVEQRELIQIWCKEHIGRRLPVTASKDFAMIELWDDRAVRVKMNTGEICQCFR